MVHHNNRRLREERLLDMINIEARGGELVAVLATKSKISILNNSLDNDAGGDKHDGGGDEDDEVMMMMRRRTMVSEIV